MLFKTRAVKEFIKTGQLWLQGLVERRGFNRAAVALANKNARIIWALMTKGEKFVWHE